MNNFIMLVGRPGVGKTTFIEENQKQITSIYGIDCYLSSDAVIEDVAQARGLTYSEVFKDSISLAGKYVESMLGILSLQQRNFILDQSNLTSKTRQRKLGLLTHPQNYNRIAVVFDDVSELTLVDRLDNRAKNSGKIIPPEVLETMKNDFVFPTYEEGFTKVMTVAEFQETLKEEKPVYGGMTFQ